MTRFACYRFKHMTRSRETTADVKPLLDLLQGLVLGSERASARDAIVRYMRTNAHRMDYARYIQHGYQIGSGSMESPHPVASEPRLKRSGPGWRPEAAQAIFDLRMLDLVGRWHEFWGHSDMEKILETAFRAV